MTPSLAAAVLRAAPGVAAQFRPGARTLPLVARCLVEFDALGSEGLIAELRGMADPVASALAVLREAEKRSALGFTPAEECDTSVGSAGAAGGEPGENR